MEADNTVKAQHRETKKIVDVIELEQRHFIQLEKSTRFDKSRFDVIYYARALSASAAGSDPEAVQEQVKRMLGWRDVPNHDGTFEKIQLLVYEGMYLGKIVGYTCHSVNDVIRALGFELYEL